MVPMQVSHPRPTTQHAAAYLRRSSVSGDNPGDASREAQETAVRRLCGDDVVLYVDWGISGRRDDRPEYLKLKAAIAAGEVGSVCAYGLSRLGRNARELLAFIKLAGKHGVPVRTAVESIDTSSAMGRAMLTVMAAFAQLEVEQGMERSAAARDAREARYTAAGLPVPPSRALFGRRHVEGPDGLLRIEPDPDAMVPVIAAWEDSGHNVRRAAKLLTERKVPAPEGGKDWGLSTLMRILDGHGLREPAPNAAGHHRPVVNRKARYANLLRCHCGATMTPNVKRGQYYCHKGHNYSHGRYSVTERALRAVLDPLASTYINVTGKFEERYKGADSAALAEIERRKARLDVRLDVGRIAPDAYRRAIAELDAEAAKLDRQERTVMILGTEPVPDLQAGDPGEVNKHLRRLWSAVQIGPDMTVADVEWIVPDWMHDEAAFAEWEASADKG